MNDLPSRSDRAPFFERLSASVQTIRAEDPFSQLLLVVPSLRDGVRVRHALARRLANGLFGVRVVTPRQLADEVAPTDLEVADDLTISLLLAELEQRTGADPGLPPKLAPPRVLERYHRVRTELVFGTLDDAPSALSRSDRALVARAYDRLAHAKLIDIHDRYREATSVIEANKGTLRGVDSVIGIVGAELGVDEARLYMALGSSDRFRLVTVGRGDIEAPSGQSVNTPAIRDDLGHVRYRSYPDPDAEVKGAVSGIVRQLDLDPSMSVAIAFPPGAGYARRVRRELRAAGLEGFGRDPNRVADSLAHRLLMGMLRVALEGLDSTTILGSFASLPIRDGEDSLQNRLWEEVARQSHLPRGAEEIRVRLGSLVKSLPPGSLIHDAARDLDRFVARSTDALDALAEVAQWKALLSWFEAHIAGLVDYRQVTDEERVRWEQACQSRLIDRLRGLSRLDGVGIVFDLTTALELVGALGRSGGPSVEHRGVGVEWMGIDDAATSDVEYLAILGMAEGTYPRSGGDLGERPLWGGMVSSLHASVTAKETYALQVAMGRAKRVEVSMARAMDRTRRGEVGWSRYVAPGISADRTLGLDDRPDRALYSTYRHALSDRMPLSASDYALRALARNEDPRRREPRPSWDPTGRLMHAAQVIEARERPLAGAFDGVVDPQVVAALGSRERPLSVSAIEHFASCPYGFFVRDVLHAPAPDRVEFTFGLGPADLGMVVHDTMEAIVTDERFDALGRSTPAEVRDQLIEEHLFPRYEEVCTRGLGGARSLWRAQYLRLVDQVGLLCDGLVQLLSEGEAHVVHRPEVTFGEPIPLRVVLGGDDSVSLRGRLDYLGVGTDRVVVVDYKTGSAVSYSHVTEDNPTSHGQKFQLGVYLHAAKSLLGEEADRSMVARYLFSRRGEHRKVRGFHGTETTMAKVDEALGLLLGAMRDGVFLPEAHGENDHCDYCVMRDLAVGVGSSQLRSKLDDPRASALVNYLSLRNVATS